MTRHCGWCGRFVANDAEPIQGVNVFGHPVAQLLCPACGPQWVDLSGRNEAFLAQPGDITMLYVGSGGIVDAPDGWTRLDEHTIVKINS